VKVSERLRRFPQISPIEMNEAQRQVYRRIQAETRAHGPNGAVGPYTVMLHDPTVAELTLDLRASALMQSVCLRPLMKEMLILLAARARNAPFVWWAHAEGAVNAGLSRDVVVAIADSRRPAFAAHDEEALYDLASVLLSGGEVSDAVFNAAREAFGANALVTIAGLLGQYVAGCMIPALAQLRPPPKPDNTAAPICNARDGRR
jgi:4-carboxymuconolactone decarboxylase